MANESLTASLPSRTLQARHVTLLAAACLVAGLVIGYFARGSRMHASGAPPMAPVAAPAAKPATAMGSGHGHSLQELKQMADKQAAPVLEKLKTDPGNVNLLQQAGAIYHTARQYNDAAVYYGRAVQADPKNLTNRTRFASSLYRGGDADGAIAQLNQALAIDANDANSLFDLGLIRWQGKHDGKGALAAWQQLLKSNPQLTADRKRTVQRLMAEAGAEAGGAQQGAQR